MFVSGTARNRLKDALFKVADHEAPYIPALPKAFEHYRYELGAEVYGSMGIPIADTARHAAAVMRNFDFRRIAAFGQYSAERSQGCAHLHGQSCWATRERSAVAQMLRTNNRSL